MSTNKSSRVSDISESDDSPKISTREHKSKNKTQKRKRKSKRNEYEKPRSSKGQSPKKKKPRSSSSSDTSEAGDKENESINPIAESPAINNKSPMDNSRESSPNFLPPGSSTLLRSVTGLESVTHRSKSPSSPKSSAPLGPIITNVERLALPTGSSVFIDSRPTDDQSIDQRTIITGPSTSRVLQSKPRKLPHLMSQQDFQAEVLTRFSTLDSEISQMNTSISQLARSAQFGHLQTAVQPDGFPTLPIETIRDFRSFDSLLKLEVYATYFKGRWTTSTFRILFSFLPVYNQNSQVISVNCDDRNTNRLAAIGGINVRQSVMHILKFAMTNRVAIEFNWVGREKEHPFQSTEMIKIITAAVKLRFADSPEATDVQISSAIKDWLKQAKHRLACQEKSLRGTP